MNGLRDQILAGTVFSKNKNRLIVSGKAFSFFLEKAHGGTLAHNRIKVDDFRALPRIERCGKTVIILQFINNILHFMYLVFHG